MKDQIIPYPEIRPHICEFTIINCKHHTWPYKWIGHTAGVHVSPETGLKSVFQSTTLDKATGISGVSLSPLGAWVDRYPGEIRIRIPEFKHHQNNIDHEYKRNKLSAEFIAANLGTSYPDIKNWSGKMKLAMAKLDLDIFGVDIFQYKGKDDGIFCTMLMVMWYNHCKLLSDAELSQESVPQDCWNDGILEDFLIDCAWSKEIRIK